ncbi:MAG TPA: C4-type zinc ribbon domain-containing protein [Oligoflexia bacterium]|nr:C4-type zinc ribbon domain-containing protein [Oligoflexia bacterium]HMR24856.1 C4-type zinc ribbon domain-containing protein [Oligoflexia bacterium]
MMHFEELLKLQTLDIELDKIKSEREGYPNQLESVKNNYDQILSQYKSLNSRVETLTAEKISLEEKLGLEVTRLNKSKIRLNEIKNNFEYQALRREIDSTEKSNFTLEQTIASHSEELQKLEESLKQKKIELEQVETEFDDVKSLVDEKSDYYAQEISKRQNEVNQYHDHIEKALLSKYKFIRTRLNKAVVCVDEGVCKGCYMSLPPQMVNEMQTKKDLYNCPNCHRILYLEDYIER